MGVISRVALPQTICARLYLTTHNTRMCHDTLLLCVVSETDLYEGPPLEPISSPGLTAAVIWYGRVILLPGGFGGVFSSPPPRAGLPNPVVKWEMVLDEPEAILSSSAWSNWSASYGLGVDPASRATMILGAHDQWSRAEKTVLFARIFVFVKFVLFSLRIQIPWCTTSPEVGKVMIQPAFREIYAPGRKIWLSDGRSQLHATTVQYHVTAYGVE